MDPKLSVEILDGRDLKANHGSNNDSIIAGSSVNDTITLSGLFDDYGNFSNTMLAGSTIDTSLLNSNWQTTTNTNPPWFTQSPNNVSSRIQLHGKNSDIEVNGWSLVSAIKRIEERLDLFQPSPELESEWEELRVLGEQYRQLEQHIKEKQATFDRLKAMPKVDID
jgi:hypothetical protein